MTKEALAVTATFLVRTFAQQVSVWCKGQKMVKFKIQDLTLVPTRSDPRPHASEPWR